MKNNLINISELYSKKTEQKHPYHLVDPSPWPLFGSLSALGLTFGGVMYMHSYTYGGFLSLLGFFRCYLYYVFMVA